MKERILLFDIARALCVIEIVCFFHILDYIDISNYEIKFIGGNITNSVLSCFTFISGFFLGKKKLEIKSFYASRLKRFLIPLLLSCIILYLGGWFSSFQQLIFTITGLSCFIGPQPLTLWYFSMLIIFYLLTPFIVPTKNERKKSIIFLNTAIIYILFWCLYWSDFLDIRLLLLFPFYVLGIFINQTNVFKIISNPIIGITCLVIYILQTMYIDAQTSILERIITNTLGIYTILFISNLIDKYLTFSHKLFSFLAYSSMFAYLFHREVYQLFKILSERIWGTTTIPISLVILMICILFIFSFWGQKLYDLFCKKHWS